MLTQYTQSEDETPHDPARLIITDAALILWLQKAAPKLDARESRPGIKRQLVTLAGAATVSVLALLFVIIPALADRLATYIPRDSEAAVGRAVVSQMKNMLGGAKACSGVKETAVLDRLVIRLVESHPTEYDIHVQVIDHPMVNAFAAPRGHIVLLRGLIESAESPDEIAGVIAHEIGHVEARDPTRLALRSAGSAGILAMILGDITGGATITLLGEALLRANYTHTAELQADEFALELLNTARISSEPFANFFDRLAKQDDEEYWLPSYLHTHPESTVRAELVRNHSALPTTKPSLSQQDWEILQSICQPAE